MGNPILVEGGGADRAGLSAAHLALVCSSHSGEPAHVEGVALKCDDGAFRAAEAAMAALLLRLLPLSEAERAVVDPLARPVLTNWRGRRVGALRPAAVLA